ncbi:amino acid adenylation domain-containing protein [Micromonospora sp. NBRC 101691]|nr:amino acid adenylation domain-containing protein [Micromonospora sp. NBRC 101691]
MVAHHSNSHPDAVALRQGDRMVTYRALTANAERVAGALRRMGVGPGDYVPVLVDRSPELVEVLLGILATGAAYLALDRRWPSDRLADTIRRAGAAVLVTDDPGEGCEGVDTVTPVELLTAGTGPPPEPLVDGGEAACVYYTSGSTGRPKGVVSPHRGTIRTLVGCPTLPLDHTTVFLQAAPLPWDGLSLELWAPLLNGGCCVLLDRGTHILDTEGFRQAIERGVNSVWLTSSLFNLLVEEAPELFGRLRLVLVGGEQVSVAHVRKVHGRFPGLRIVNGYGPAESTIFTTTHVVRGSDLVESCDEIPIGRPVPGTAVLLLSADGRPTGPGEVGEVAVAGDGLALGYLADPVETAKRFITIGGARYYRSGDLAVQDEEGNLRYRGRIDRQFKINGIRIEPGEVEATLGRYPGITSCRVLRLEADTGRSHLACLYTTADDAPIDEMSLRAAAGRKLLAAMVPTVLRRVPRLPLNANGKVDQAVATALLAEVLPREAPPQSAGDERGAVPAGDLLASVRDVLDRHDLHDADDLTALGLTSLDALRVAARVSRVLGIRATITDVYRLRTVERMLAHWSRLRPAAPPLLAAPEWDETPAPLTHVQRRFWIAEQTLPGCADNLIVLAYLLTGDLDVAALRQALNDVVLRHPALRTIFPVDDDLPVQRVLPPGDLALSFDETTIGADDGAAQPDLSALVTAVTRDWWDRPFDLEHELPIRVRLCRLHDRRALLCLHLHHIAFDGSSEPVLVADLQALYQARRSGIVPDLPPVLSYVDYARWEHRYLETWVAEELPFWRGALRHRSPPMLPPPDTPGETTRIESVLHIPATRVDQLRHQAAGHGGPPVAALLAGTGIALARTFDVPELFLGTATAGRVDPALSRVVGCFVNPLPVPLVDLRRLPPSAVLAQASTISVQALDHSRVPFDELVRILRPERGRHPWFQVWSVLQQPRPRGEFAPGLSFAPVRVPPPTTALELMFDVTPMADSSWEIVLLRRCDGVTDDQARRLLLETDRALTELTGARSADTGLENA